MGGRVYYNENDPFAAATLRELIADGLIAPGHVDERSIADVRADDLAGFRQHHFFAGFGVWSAALRLAGWPDDEPVWTASCPCPPFSSAGPNFRCPICDTRSPVPNAVRTGAFDCIRCGHEWQADARHLFPELFRLAREYRPREILGEQVASADGRTWLDVVSASLEMLGYAVGATDTCAAGFGAPHIRQREYWLADATCGGQQGASWRGSPQDQRIAECAVSGSMANPMFARRPERRPIAGDRSTPRGGGIVRLAHPLRDGTEHPAGQGLGAQAEADGGNGSVSGQRLRPWLEGASVRLADASHLGHEWPRAAWGRRDGLAVSSNVDRPGPTNGLWRGADWLGCADGKWRPVEPGTFPLAHAGAFRNRVAELRGAGNAVNVAQAAGFIQAVMAHRAASTSEAA